MVGIAGEQYASQSLDPTAVAAYVANPVLPHPNNALKYLETDLLVYAAGTLFCVEIKNYRGVISHVLGDPGQIVQQKNGRYGEAIPAKLHQNPLRQAKRAVIPTPEETEPPCGANSDTPREQTRQHHHNNQPYWLTVAADRSFNRRRRPPRRIRFLRAGNR